MAFTTTQTPKVGGDVLHTIEAASKTGGGQTPAVLAFHHKQNPISGNVSPAIGRTTDGMGVMTFAERGRADGRSVEVRTDVVVNSLLTPNGGRSGTGAGDAIVQTLVVGGRDKGAGDSYDNTPVIAQVLSFEPRYYLRDNKTGGAPSDLVRVDASIGKNGDAVPHVVCTTGHVTHALTHEGADASEDGTGRGTPIVVNCITAREAKGWNPAREVGNGTVQTGRPRRLTPKECERLMGWPDDWTRYGRKEDGTVYELSDTARYRLCGNGVGSPCAAWIARRLAWAVSC